MQLPFVLIITEHSSHTSMGRQCIKGRQEAMLVGGHNGGKLWLWEEERSLLLPSCLLTGSFYEGSRQ